MEKILYNKCVYKRIDYDLYIVPFSHGKYIKAKVIKNGTSASFKENDTFIFGLKDQVEKSFNDNYKPYIWDGGLFKNKDKIIFIKSLENESCIIFNRTDKAHRSTIKLQDLISMNLLPADIVNNWGTAPDLMVYGYNIWSLIEDNKYYLKYENNKKMSWFTLKDKVLPGDYWSFFKNGNIWKYDL